MDTQNWIDMVLSSTDLVEGDALTNSDKVTYICEILVDFYFEKFDITHCFISILQNGYLNISNTDVLAALVYIAELKCDVLSTLSFKSIGDISENNNLGEVYDLLRWRIENKIHSIHHNVSVKHEWLN